MEIEYNFCLNISINNLQIHFNPNGLDDNGYNQWASDDYTYSINFLSKIFHTGLLLLFLP